MEGKLVFMRPPVRIEEVIITTIERAGDGITYPIREVTSVWSKNGELIASQDQLLPLGAEPKIDRSAFFQLAQYLHDNLNAFQEEPARLTNQWLSLRESKE
ncbi:hypothetical protein [Spirosoma aerophilum]